MPISSEAQAEASIAPDETGIQDNAQASFSRILVALDASEHANHALAEAVRLAASVGGTVTGIHAYAAKLHDNRFKQMEGGLPERYRKEDEMERQRVVHDTLITRGLGVISDSYHDAAIPVCEAADVPYRRLSPEGKNYRRIVEAASSGEHDCLALGTVGLGVVPGSVVGTVCERVVRRSFINVLVIRDPKRSIGDGPLVVGLDGSARSFGALKTALELARRFGVQVHAVAAYDPYYHYVAFTKIAAVLSEEASQEFRFKEQEQLHEEIIDSGIAQIYQSHLDIACSTASLSGRSRNMPRTTMPACCFSARPAFMPIRNWISAAMRRTFCAWRPVTSGSARQPICRRWRQLPARPSPGPTRLKKSYSGFPKPPAPWCAWRFCALPRKAVTRSSPPL
jgi:nucleotide-binding universal stress UspA family protein